MWPCGVTLGSSGDHLSYALLAHQEGFTMMLIGSHITHMAPPCFSMSPHRTIWTHFSLQTTSLDFFSQSNKLKQCLVLGIGPSCTQRSSVSGRLRRAGQAPGQALGGQSRRGRLMESICFFGPGRPLARNGAHYLRSAAAGDEA